MALLLVAAALGWSIAVMPAVLSFLVALLLATGWCVWLERQTDVQTSRRTL